MVETHFKYIFVYKMRHQLLIVNFQHIKQNTNKFVDNYKYRPFLCDKHLTVV